MCKRPDYKDIREDTFKTYGCGACSEDEKSKGCVDCKNDPAGTPCNTKQPDAVHAYMCKTMKKDSSDSTGKTWIAGEDKECTVKPGKDAAADKALEDCFKGKADWAKPAKGVTDENYNILMAGGCGKCSAIDSTIQPGCEDYMSGSSAAAAMSFILAPLLAVLFWLH